MLNHQQQTTSAVKVFQAAGNTLFRIASMTKPITSTMALMRLEEGRFALNDPITRWAPEFARMRVLCSSAGPLDQTVPAARLIPFADTGHA